jgi:hypothetical protein
LDFALYPWRFTFVAHDALYFPQGKAGNILRGALGSIFREIDVEAYAQLFRPEGRVGGPSGFADRPRPFVLRASRLDGRRVVPGERFDFDLHVFAIQDPALERFRTAFARLAEEGLGPGRGRAELVGVEQLDEQRRPGTGPERLQPLRIPIDKETEPVRRVLVRFVTPTELKAGRELVERPEFGVLIARVRDRVSGLRALYGEGPLDIDHKALGERAAEVRMPRCEIRHVEVERRSTRTGQVHPLGGFVGEAEYEGDLAAFVPWLRVAEWTGVGRQTVWGKGEIACEVLG